jgi:asparagine synthase (glutamine-hydrolysing)
MCGIYGLVSKRPIAAAEVSGRNDRLRHRGPDGAGLLLFSREETEVPALAGYDLLETRRSSRAYDVALAHRRLSIVDLAGGVQPMCNEDETVWVTFNGEIYNFRELRSELQHAGHRFRSDHSDTEVIVHGWEQWGESCLSHFNGMFSFALYDAARGKIFFARDRAGEKPFYYRASETSFEFASEIQALDSSRQRDPRALNFFLAMGYIPGGLTLFNDTAKLPPAHAGLLDLDTWKLSVWKYWSLPPPPEAPIEKEEPLVDELEALLEDSVSLRLVSDVPLGIFLSGGLDSSLVAAMAARASSAPVKTFTITMPGARTYDEAAFARAIATAFRTEHTELEASIGMLDSLEAVLGKVGEPIGDSSFLPTWLVSRLGRAHVTVALGGDGADELFGGYSHHKMIPRAAQRLAWVPNAAWSLVGMAAECLPPGMRGRNLLYSMRASPRQSSVWGTPFFSVPMRQRVLGRGVGDLLEGHWDEPERWKLDMLEPEGELLDQLTRLDFLSYLPEDILVKVDRASMLNSLEVRAPWLDHRIVEFAFGKVPASMKVRNGQGKWLEKRLAARVLPKDFPVERKQGFSIPLDRWLRRDENVRRHLPQSDSAFRQSAIDTLVDGERRGQSNGARLFALMSIHYAASGAVP